MKRLKFFRQITICSLWISAVFPVHAQITPVSDKLDNLMPPTKTAATTNNYPVIDTLELVGVGISVETWRNNPSYPKHNLWKMVEESKGSYVISQDIKHYPKNLAGWQMLASKRNQDVIEIALRDFMDRYPIPIAAVGPAWRGEDTEKARERAREAYANSIVTTGDGFSYKEEGRFSGLLTQSGQVMNSYLHDNPDLLWQFAQLSV